MARTRRANRYCIDCGSRLVYYPRLSNPKAPNEHRVLVYACPDCTEDFEKPKMFSVKRNIVNEPLETVELEIHQKIGHPLIRTLDIVFGESCDQSYLLHSML